MKCRRCGINKSVNSFYQWDRYKCKDCRKQIDRERYPKRKRYLRKYWIKWYLSSSNQKKHSQNGVIYARRWDKRNPLARRAQILLNRAVQSGKIAKNTVCGRCRRQYPSSKIDAHHQDYTKPYEVLWLCRSCHKTHHLELKKLPGIANPLYP